MNALFVALSAAGYASAQLVNGYSMVSMPAGMNYYGSSAPPQATDSSTVTASAAYSTATAPPTSTTDFYSIMPYESMTAGGYSSLECGYGYTKASNGYCEAESWVSFQEARRFFLLGF